MNFFLKRNDLNFTKNISILLLFGFLFSTVGLFLGVMWAKQAWGHYWRWDPKESWALISWLYYAIFFHLFHELKNNKRIMTFYLAGGFLLICTCWFAVNRMPSSSTSLHTYSLKK